MRTLFFLTLSFVIVSCDKDTSFKKQASDFLKDKIMADAKWAMSQEPETITSFQSDRSEGGIHDFYSEGDYWWPSPDNPDGPYIRKDGETNPDNFVAHRLAMIRFSKVVGYLASAYIITNDEKYVDHAFRHIKAWFVDSTTYMNPSLLYAQAIKGISSGRGIGIIDTIHLMEVAQGIIRMQNAACVNNEDLMKIKQWFSDYINWLTSHPYGISEMNAKNNHGTCWVMQVASFAKLTENKEILKLCSNRYKEVLLPNQMAGNGSFPQELDRTKPYGYSLFNLNAMASICQILSTDEDNLWDYTANNGASIRKGIDFMYPYVLDKGQWPYKKDVMYWDEWPVAQTFLIFGAVNYNEVAYFDLWKSLKHDSSVQEVERNFPIRNPLIWL
ncbi:MAG: alginate lyase family protein [Petrimonas sp.]|nr:alginate lyase family protein [Petrimonas sp.]